MICGFLLAVIPIVSCSVEVSVRERNVHLDIHINNNISQFNGILAVTILNRNTGAAMNKKTNIKVPVGHSNVLINNLEKSTKTIHRLSINIAAQSVL